MGPERDPWREWRVGAEADNESAMTTRKAAKERTRQKLIEATLQVLHEQGPSALTTGRIAEAAGVAQPTFYVHFRDMDDALTQAAESAGERLLARFKDYRSDMEIGAPADRVRSMYSATIKGLLGEPQLAELFLRHRRDVASPIGKRWREITDRGRDDLLADFKRIGLDTVLPDVDVYAELVVGMTFGLAEALLDGRIEDRERALDTVTAFSQAAFMTLFQESQAKAQKKKEAKT